MSDQMTLGELIAALEAADQGIVLPNGFDEPHSYRGYYEQLAFEPATDVTVAQMLASAYDALDTDYEGYKGGQFTMTAETDCWVAYYGACGEELTSERLQGMLAVGRPGERGGPSPTPDERSAEPMTDERLGEIQERAARYARWPAPATHDWALQVGTRDLPALLAEVERLREEADASDQATAERGDQAREYKARLDKMTRWAYDVDARRMAAERDRDEARAEVERLRAEMEETRDTIADPATGYITRLAKTEAERDAAHAETLRRHHAWQSARRGRAELRDELASAWQNAEDWHETAEAARSGREQAEAERDRLAEQAADRDDRIRSLHREVCGGACGLDDACECAYGEAVCDEDRAPYPCPTIRALDGTEAGT